MTGAESLYWRPGVITYPLCQDCGAKLTGQPRVIVGRWYCCQSCALRRAALDDGENTAA